MRVRSGDYKELSLSGWQPSRASGIIRVVRYSRREFHSLIFDFDKDLSPNFSAIIKSPIFLPNFVAVLVDFFARPDLLFTTDLQYT